MPRKYTDARKDSNKKWDAANLDRLSIAVPKGKKDVIKSHAESGGESVNGFINRAIDEVLCKEGEYRMIDNSVLEKRCRYRFSLHGWTLHKEHDEYGKPCYYITDDVNTERPDDDDQERWMTFDEVMDLCETVEEEDAVDRAEKMAERRANKD